MLQRSDHLNRLNYLAKAIFKLYFKKLLNYLFGETSAQGSKV